MDLKLLHKECLHKDMVLLTKVTQLSNSQVMDHPNNKEVIDLLNKEVTHHLKGNQGMALLRLLVPKISKNGFKKHAFREQD